MSGFRSVGDVESFSKSVFKAMDDLTEVIEAETDLVRAGQLVSATALQAQKTKHAEHYVQLMEQARHHGGQIKTLSPILAEKLLRAQEVFKATLQINMAALSTARDLSQSLMKGVADNMSKRENPTTYTQAGGSSTAYQAPAKGIAVNRSL